jgi:hypothetical protein
MADDSIQLPPSRIVRWVVLGAVILGAVGLYFRSGRYIPPVSAPAAAVPGAPAVPTTR